MFLQGEIEWLPKQPILLETLQDYPIKKLYAHIIKTWPMSFLVLRSIVLLVNRWRLCFKEKKTVILTREGLIQYFSHLRLFKLQYLLMPS